MSTAMEVFQFPPTGQRVRTLVRSGEPWFVARDVCAVLGLSNGRMSVARLDEDEKGVSQIDTPGGPQQMAIVNEPGLYELIVRSDKPAAKSFRRWVTHDVLPAIRKTGGYGQSRELSRLEILELALESERRAIAAEAHVAELEPKAKSWDVLVSADGDYSVRDSAYILNRDPNINTGQNRLFALLREWRLIDRYDRPYANHAAHVRLRPRTRKASDGDEVTVKPQVRLTVEGLRYLHRRMGGTAPLTLHSPHGPAEPVPLPSGSAGPLNGGSG